MNMRLKNRKDGKGKNGRNSNEGDGCDIGDAVFLPCNLW